MKTYMGRCRVWCENNKVHAKTSCVKVYKFLLRYIWKESNEVENKKGERRAMF